MRVVILNGEAQVCVTLDLIGYDPVALADAADTALRVYRAMDDEEADER